MSPLMDPMILESDMAKPVVGVGEKLSGVDWLWTFVNVIIPFFILVVVAFYMKSCYDTKKERMNELML